MWTDERVELLKKLWNDGLSASQIAVELGGITRNARRWHRRSPRHIAARRNGPFDCYRNWPIGRAWQNSPWE